MDNRIVDRAASGDRRWIALGGLWLIGLMMSGAVATDLATWAMEVAPVSIAFLLIAGTRGGRGAEQSPAGADRRAWPRADAGRGL